MNRRSNTPHIFGIRHLSPGSACHLLKFLDEIRPEAVLIEGLSDANTEIHHLTSDGTKPPVAILAYTEEFPVRTIMYPFVNYSPEYQALVWAKNHGAHAEFIDLPSEVMIPLGYQWGKAQEQITNEQDTGLDNRNLQDGPGKAEIYQRWAKTAGVKDFETYWEYNFEHIQNTDVYRFASFELSKCLRELLMIDAPLEYAKNTVREAYMRSRILNTYSPDKIVVIAGILHVSALDHGKEHMDEKEFKKLPRVRTKIALMPYTYNRLSSISGHGVGNNAPAYYGMTWDAFRKNTFKNYPARYLSIIASYLRENGIYRSSADVIEGVRLANALAALHSSVAPSRRDLRDAAITCLGYGDFSVVAEAIADTDIGSAIGSLPEGVSRTSIHDDFCRELKRLKLEKYKSPVARRLDLDLRENRRVNSKEAAFRDLNRSFFLHRLRVLNISFQRFMLKTQKSATWSESWILGWTSVVEIELAESILKGETVELATAYVFKERLDNSQSITEVASVIRDACECGMMESMEQAKQALQRLAVDSVSFTEIAKTALELSFVISYGSIRRFDTSNLVPLLQQLFLKGALLMPDSSRCDSDSAWKVIDAINSMNYVALEHAKTIDEDLWISKLTELSDADDRNPLLSGYACSILLERGKIDDTKLTQEISRRLSPGIDADIGSGWFEGLSIKNRYALLSRMSLWEQMDKYIYSLDTEQFKRALVFLRRAFSLFSPAEKRRISENLGQIWGISKKEAVEILNFEVDIIGLNEFDFEDI